MKRGRKRQDEVSCMYVTLKLNVDGEEVDWDRIAPQRLLSVIPTAPQPLGRGTSESEVKKTNSDSPAVSK